MISDIKQAIVNKLLEIYPSGYTIYDEDIPQNFKTPSFLITLIEQDYSKRLNTIYKGLVSFDVAYFSDKGIAKIKADCLQKQEALLRAFDFIGTYKVLNKNARITDNVLHMTFDVSYSEVKTETEIPMQTQETTTNI
ncbi:MAG: hypothetical protein PHD60_05720 [Clostridia bacterium]|nr:hypothetical protein [Clostridia bacterium]